jgi:hypothetical protein
LKRLAPKEGPPWPAPPDHIDQPPADFIEWLSLSSRVDWKMGWWTSGEVAVAKLARKEAKETFGVARPANWLNVTRVQARAGDWLLCFQLSGGRFLKWLHVDFVVKVDRSDARAYEKGYPFQAVQANPLKHCPRPPFNLDGVFKSAFKRALAEFGDAKIEHIGSMRPPSSFLRLIADKMR